MKNTVTLTQLSAFMRSCYNQMDRDFLTGWMNSPSNAKTPLGECITGIRPHIIAALKPLDDCINEYNRNLSRIKAEYAEEITVSENSQSPEHSVTQYKYIGRRLQERNDTIQSYFDDFLAKKKAIEDRTVEIEVFYVKNVPNETMLPSSYITFFRGLVIAPEYDSNIKPAIHLPNR